VKAPAAVAAAYALVALLASGLVVLWAGVCAASAHAVLLRSDPPDLCLLPGGESLPSDAPPCRAGAVLPQPPSAIHLVFSEPVQPIGRGLRVIGPNGRRVDYGAVGVTGPVLRVGVDARPAGTYRVVWSVISQDTHPELGTMTFSVRRAGGLVAQGAAAGGTDLPTLGGSAGEWGLALGALAHVLHFAGYALGFGAYAAFWAVRRGPPPFGGPPTPEAVWRLVGAGIVLLLLAEPASVVAESVALGAVGGGADPAVVGTLLDSSFGRVIAQRLAVAILLWVLAGALRNGAMRATWTVPLLGVGLAFIDGQAAHAAGVRPVWLGLTVNAAHVCAMGLWAGTLAFILSSRAGAARPPDVHRLVAATAATAVASGAVMAAEHLAAVRDLIASPYGRALAVKITAVAAVVGLGWCAARLGPARRTGVLEAAAMLAVLALAGWLVLLRPPVP
jgi:methionine-rich copper-binding protein CopC/putative copper export protein